MVAETVSSQDFKIKKRRISYDSNDSVEGLLSKVCLSNYRNTLLHERSDADASSVSGRWLINPPNNTHTRLCSGRCLLVIRVPRRAERGILLRGLLRGRANRSQLLRFELATLIDPGVHIFFLL